MFDSFYLSASPPFKVAVEEVDTFFSNDSCRVKCVLQNLSALPFIIKNRPTDHLELGLHYEWEIIEPNARSFSWDLGNGTVSKQKKVIFFAAKEGEREICATFSFLDWFSKSLCFNVYVKKPAFGLSHDSNEAVSFGEILVSEDDEIIGGVNYGKLLKIGSQIWLSKDVGIERKVFYLDHKCPKGYKPPTYEDYVNLIGTLGTNASYVLLEIANFNQSLYYLTSNKSLSKSESGTGGNPSDFDFKGLLFDENRVYTADVCTWWSPELNTVRCVRDDYNKPFEIEGFPMVDLYQGSEIPLNILISNAVSISIVNGDFSTTEKSIIFEANKLGRNEICITARLFAGFIKTYCHKIYVITKFEKDVNTTLTESKYHYVPLPIKIVKFDRFHFNPGSVQLAPKNDGNSYLLYSESSTLFTFVVELSPDGNMLSQCNLSLKARALDITETSWGFAAYISLS